MVVLWWFYGGFLVVFCMNCKKLHFFCIFLHFFLHISRIFRTFAVVLE